MKKYAVQIRATIIKTIIVKADDEDNAIDAAHESFNCSKDNHVDDWYDQEELSCNLVKRGEKK